MPAQSSQPTIAASTVATIPAKPRSAVPIARATATMTTTATAWFVAERSASTSSYVSTLRSAAPTIRWTMLCCRGAGDPVEVNLSCDIVKPRQEGWSSRRRSAAALYPRAARGDRQASDALQCLARPRLRFRRGGWRLLPGGTGAVLQFEKLANAHGMTLDEYMGAL